MNSFKVIFCVRSFRYHFAKNFEEKMASTRSVTGYLFYCVFMILSSDLETLTGLGYINMSGGCRKGSVELSYACIGPSTRMWQNLPPIILLHGILDSKKTWTFVAPKLVEFTGRKVYALDMRNHGGSPWNEEFTLNALADDLDCFLQQHRISKAVLVGHSLGAKTIMSFALRKPEKVEKVVFEDMMVKNLEANQWQVVGQAIQTIRKVEHVVSNNADERRAKEMIASSVVASFAPEESRNLPPQFAARAISTLPIKRTRDGYYFWQANLDILERAVATPGYLDQCPKGTYNGDALFIYGTESFINVLDDFTILKHFPYAQFIPVEGSSHLVHQLHTEEYLTHVIKFINSPPSANIQELIQYTF